MTEGLRQRVTANLLANDFVANQLEQAVDAQCEGKELFVFGFYDYLDEFGHLVAVDAIAFHLSNPGNLRFHFTSYLSSAV